MVTYTRRLALGILCASTASGKAKPEMIVAAAANLTQAMQAIGPAFEAQTGIHPVFSFASTAQLAQQAANGAPFDVILAADSGHIDQLERGGFLAPGSRAVYARGILALWIPGGAAVNRVEDLARPRIRTIAIAKPELAPYGAAAVAALKRTGIWNQVESKVVYAENINMARQYGALGNADAVFTAGALLQNAPGVVVRVDPSLYPPIEQSLAILGHAEHPAAARQFVEYLLHGKGHEALLRAGYLAPALLQ